MRSNNIEIEIVRDLPKAETTADKPSLVALERRRLSLLIALMFSPKGIAISLVKLAFMASTAQAAELTRVSSGACDYLLTGIIESGDADKLDKIGGTYDGTTLCLNSPGGSLPEGKKIFDLIWDSNIKTRVRAGDTCESACALAFLGGSINTGTANVRYQARAIEPGARLGFHAPGLGLDNDAVYSGEVVRSAFEAALDAAEMIFAIKLTEEHGVRAMPDYLYQRLLSKRRSDMYYVSTIGDAVMSNIDLVNVTLPASIGEAQIANICDNAWAAHVADGQPGFESAADYFAQLKNGFYGERKVSITSAGRGILGKVYDYYSVVKFGALGCSVAVPDGWRTGDAFYPRFHSYSLGFDFGPNTDNDVVDSEYNVPLWYALNSETPISATMGAARAPIASGYGAALAADQIALLHIALHDLGYYTPRGGRTVTPQTEGAVTRWAQDRGWNPPAALRPAHLADMQSELADRRAVGDAAALMRRVQRAMTILGHYRGAIDGRLTTATQAALAEWARGHGWTPPATLRDAHAEHMEQEIARR